MRSVMVGIAAAMALAVSGCADLPGTWTGTGTVQSSPVQTSKCAWASDGDETNVIVSMHGNDDCQNAFSAISETGFNWETVGSNWNYGQTACVLNESGETMTVYVVNQVPEPLTDPGNSLCGSAEQAGWMPQG